MFHVFDGRTADEVWSNIAAAFRSADGLVSRPSRAGRVLELGNVCLSIAEPHQRWVVSREPALNPAFAIAEVVWILNGRNDSRFLNYFNRQLPRFAGDVEEYPGAYGYRLRNALGFDQLDRAYSALHDTPESRQVVLQIWDGRSDLPSSDGTPTSADIPCNIISLLKVRDGRLDWTQILRSNDVYLGLPHNLVQFTTLQEVMAGWLKLQCGAFHLVTDSLHLYERDLVHIRAMPTRTPACNNDSMSLNRTESEAAFASLAEYVEVIIDHETTAQQIFDSACAIQLPLAHRNMLQVLAAEGLRRRKAIEMANHLMTACTNPSLVQLWDRWTCRVVQKINTWRSEPFHSQRVEATHREEESHAILE